MNETTIRQLSVRQSRRIDLQAGMAMFIAIAVLSCLPVSDSHAQILQLARNVYTSKFTCGSQRPSSVNLPTPLEPGRYATSFALFNPTTIALSNIRVSVSIPNQPNVAIDSVSLAPLETALFDCGDILNRLGVLPVPDAVVGHIYATHSSGEIEVQPTFTRTTRLSDGAGEGAAMDVEKISPRQINLLRQL